MVGLYIDTGTMRQPLAVGRVAPLWQFDGIVEVRHEVLIDRLADIRKDFGLLLCTAENAAENEQQRKK
jgi:hypothetical protein